VAGKWRLDIISSDWTAQGRGYNADVNTNLSNDRRVLIDFLMLVLCISSHSAHISEQDFSRVTMSIKRLFVLRRVPRAISTSLLAVM
jgi:hypothetical protein